MPNHPFDPNTGLYLPMGDKELFREFTIVEVGHDVLLCKDNRDVQVLVAKPWALRKSSWDGETFDGVAYTSTDVDVRDADDGSGAVEETVTPSYVVNEKILCVRVSADVTLASSEIAGESSGDRVVDWCDMNTTGRDWRSPSPLTTKGDLFTYDTGDTRLPIGDDDQLLAADAAEATGLKWIDPPSGGSASYLIQQYNGSRTVQDGVFNSPTWGDGSTVASSGSDFTISAGNKYIVCGSGTVDKLVRAEVQITWWDRYDYLSSGNQVTTKIEIYATNSSGVSIDNINAGATSYIRWFVDWEGTQFSWRQQAFKEFVVPAASTRIYMRWWVTTPATIYLGMTSGDNLFSARLIG